MLEAEIERLIKTYRPAFANFRKLQTDDSETVDVIVSLGSSLLFATSKLHNYDDTNDDEFLNMTKVQAESESFRVAPNRSNRA